MNLLSRFNNSRGLRIQMLKQMLEQMLKQMILQF